MLRVTFSVEILVAFDSCTGGYFGRAFVHSECLVEPLGGKYSFRIRSCFYVLVKVGAFLRHRAISPIESLEDHPMSPSDSGQCTCFE